jgi:hypothetical protein
MLRQMECSIVAEIANIEALTCRGESSHEAGQKHFILSNDATFANSRERSTGVSPIVFGMVLLAFSVFKNMTHFTIVL